MNPVETARAVLRRKTRAVSVGSVGIGGDNPIRVQSMTTPATTDTAATVAQIVRLVEAGCEIVRVTVPTTADADNLPNIRRELARRGVAVPLVADIHFTPAAAMKAVEHVEKIRINPGNFADKKRFAVREYTDAEYDAELGRIHRVVTPLVKRAKELGVAMRIGTNHGSLSDRIMNRFGDTPEGMVESAIEFVRICEDWDYRELVLSMKSSNPGVVLAAYRMLVARMDALGMDYPLHLGVTEAGDGEDGRIKSALGIGVLLEEGIGDTVRVSLTEDPVAEVPVAFALIAPFNKPRALVPPDVITPLSRASVSIAVGPRSIGAGAPVAVEVPLAAPLSDLDALRRELDGEAGVRVPEETRAEIVSVVLDDPRDIGAASKLRASMDLVAPRVGLSVRVSPAAAARMTQAEWEALFASVHRVHVPVPGPVDAARRAIEHLAALTGTGRASLHVEGTATRGDAGEAVAVAALAACRPGVMTGLDPALDLSPLHAYRELGGRLSGRHAPVALIDRPALRGADPMLGPAIAIGGLLCQGLGDSVQIDAGSATESRRLAFNVLQAARIRMTKTEFISCPSCGRTLFDLETTTAAIKAKTAHLKGLKIAVMGCVVNGPGEMADADFGYVGWGDEKIALFVGKEMVARDIPTAEAADRLVDLIKTEGKWIDP